jgi:hypothetical protein
MYVDAKMIPVETIAGIRRGWIKGEVEEVNSCVIYLIHCKNLC